MKELTAERIGIIGERIMDLAPAALFGGGAVGFVALHTPWSFPAGMVAGGIVVMGIGTTMSRFSEWYWRRRHADLLNVPWPTVVETATLMQSLFGIHEHSASDFEWAARMWHARAELALPYDAYVNDPLDAYELPMPLCMPGELAVAAAERA